VRGGGGGGQRVFLVQRLLTLRDWQFYERGLARFASPLHRVRADTVRMHEGGWTRWPRTPGTASTSANGSTSRTCA